MFRLRFCFNQDSIYTPNDFRFCTTSKRELFDCKERENLREINPLFESLYFLLQLIKRLCGVAPEDVGTLPNLVKSGMFLLVYFRTSFYLWFAVNFFLAQLSNTRSERVRTWFDCFESPISWSQVLLFWRTSNVQLSLEQEINIKEPGIKPLG